MNISKNYAKCLALVFTLGAVSGCAEFKGGDRAGLENQWQQYNPDWQPPAPEDPALVWSSWGWPRTAQDPYIEGVDTSAMR